MSTKLKLYLGRKIIDSLHKSTVFTPAELQPMIRVNGGADSPERIELSVPLGALETGLGVTNVNEILKIEPDDIIRGVRLVRDRANRRIAFEIDRGIFVRDVLENCAYPDLNFRPRRIVVEFSSPNVAKPFHVGHLRSTIVGNFVGNLNSFVRNKVTRLNYLGDWGTQFGFVKVGVRRLNYTVDDVRKDPLRVLYESYVHANKLAEKDPLVLSSAREEFAKLESGSEKEVNEWKQFMEFSKQELVQIYKRLGVTFDEYNYESDYGAQAIQDVIEELRSKNIIHKDKDGKEVAEIDDRNVSVVKSDGSTLYLTRDIAAAIDRFKKYDFDKMYYVVDNSQSDHFHALKSVLYKMDKPWAHRIFHVKFGRIKGMSSRKGNAVFLRDILDESRDIMIKKQIESPNTKVPISDGNISDILGVSCVIINDLKRRRQKDYEFNWESALQVKGDTGISLQYTHCRLCSLEKNSGAIPARECVPEILIEPEVTLLLKEMAKFHDVLYNANEQLESYIVVNYLFSLCNHINKAFRTLQVKGTDPEVGSQRLLVFNCAREVLRNGMIILGLQPLEQM